MTITSLILVIDNLANPLPSSEEGPPSLVCQQPAVEEPLQEHSAGEQAPALDLEVERERSQLNHLTRYPQAKLILRYSFWIR